MLRALAKHGRRGFASIASPVPPPVPPPVQWLKAFKAATEHLILRGLVSGCGASPCCARVVCCFARRSEQLKRKINLVHYTAAPLPLKTFVWNDSASLMQACVNISETYTTTLFTVVIGVAGLSFTFGLRDYDLKGTELRFSDLEAAQALMVSLQSGITTEFNIYKQQTGELDNQMVEMNLRIENLEQKLAALSK
ncbi:unnamed protein product [Brassica oleracea var. botrytis]|uniref:Uncharacterized protein n=2 Tax=Brassica oleracea TaxID=3712 RepID=A0A0D3A2F3_BRAOL|nr:PREDICTED: uncharacterized protein LOC106342784 [Brassica oleracea var. oleracea]VDD48189.1 unnamed protein product [Brassica oleracea]